LDEVAAKFCPQCGATIEASGAPTTSPPAATNDESCDFQVIEAHHDDTGFLNQDDSSTPKRAPEDRDADQLEITGNDPNALGDPDFSQAPLLDPVDEPQPAAPSDSAEEFLTGRTGEPSPPPQPKSEPEPVDPNGIPRLSQEQVQEIEQRMQIKQNTYLSEEEKTNLLASMDKTDQPFGNTPIVPPKKALAQAQGGGEKDSAKPDSPPAKPLFQGGGSAVPQPTPPAEEPSAGTQSPRRMAYFYKNYVQLTGNPHLHDHDELTLGSQVWTLKRKQFSTGVILAVLSPIAALILFVVALQLVDTGSRGDGSMIGMVIDEYEQPFVHGARIRLPELGKTYESNAEGFFMTDRLPAGSYRVEWLVDGEIVGAAFATVVDNEISTLTIRPSEELVEELEASQGQPQHRASAEPTPAPATRQSQPTKPQTASNTSRQTAKPAATKRTPKKATTSASRKPTTAKLDLAANIDNAKLMLSGKVLGRGNLTYSRLKPGTHNYMVVADGYEAVSGKVTLKAGETKTLKVTLPALAQAEKEEVYTADDFYFSGANAYRDGAYETAITDLTEAIRLDPNYAKAYSTRGDTYAIMREKELAHNDYVRAAEIYRFKKQYSYAITAYNEALSMDDKSVTANMGRASLFMARGEEVAAIADYESVIRVDRRNFDAYLGLGKARLARSNYRKAIKAFKDARSIRKDDPIVHQYLMLAYMADSDFDEVQKSYEDFVEVASPEVVDDFKKDQTYSAIRRVVKEN